MQGRSAGSPEGMLAARYLAEELKRFGVAPAGDDGTYFQRVPMGRTEFLAIPELKCADTAGAEITARAGVDFDLAEGGCDARELKVVTVASAAEIPKQADSGAALVLLAANATERGAWLSAAGIPDGTGWGLIVALGAKEAGSRPMERPPRARGRVAPQTPRISVRGTLRAAFAERRIASLTLHAPIRSIELESANVIGIIRGASAQLAEDVIALSAHYDHLPPRVVPEGQDGIFNGADDDASGCAVVLELAEAFAAGKRPPRTLLFFFATGEEIGLVGTNYALDHPPVPIDKIVVDINFEMLGRPDPELKPPARMWLTGFERSDLGDELVRLGVPVVADFRLQQSFFTRSDNYALALRGVVAQTLSSFGLHEDYHKVSDEIESLDYTHMEACAQGALVGCRRIADGEFRPSWRPGLDPSKPKARERNTERQDPTPPKDG